MLSVHDWLQTQTAGDIMARDVAALRPSDRLADAVSLFLREQISGAPVIDDQGVCVGVLSATDMLRFDEEHADCRGACETARRCTVALWGSGIGWWREHEAICERVASQLDECVAQFMTSDVVSVSEAMPLETVMRHMIDAHVHRILVLDHDGRLNGIITTMDVLAAALRAGVHQHGVVGACGLAARHSLGFPQS